MSQLFQELKTGLEQAVAIKEGRLEGRKTYYAFRPVKHFTADEIRAVRREAEMTQRIFADFLGVSRKTVEAWESGINHPTGPACRLMELLQNNGKRELPFRRPEEQQSREA